MEIVKINKKNLNEVLNIVNSFGYRPQKAFVKNNRLHLSKSMLKYVESRLSGKAEKLVEVKDSAGSTYFLELIDGALYITRVLFDGRETKVFVSSKHLKDIKDTMHVTKKEMQKLVKAMQGEFGL